MNFFYAGAKDVVQITDETLRDIVCIRKPVRQKSACSVTPNPGPGDKAHFRPVETNAETEKNSGVQASHSTTRPYIKQTPSHDYASKPNNYTKRTPRPVQRLTSNHGDIANQ